MFSKAEKQRIAEQVEKLLLELHHPEMPTERPIFHLRVEGKESWSWADIDPNWMFESKAPGVNPWNEQSHSDIAAGMPAVTKAVENIKNPQPDRN